MHRPVRVQGQSLRESARPLGRGRSPAPGARAFPPLWASSIPSVVPVVPRAAARWPKRCCWVRSPQEVLVTLPPCRSLQGAARPGGAAAGTLPMGLIRLPIGAAGAQGGGGGAVAQEVLVGLPRCAGDRSGESSVASGPGAVGRGPRFSGHRGAAPPGPSGKGWGRSHGRSAGTGRFRPDTPLVGLLLQCQPPPKGFEFICTILL